MAEPSKNKPFFILASASPRRRRLLTEAGYNFEVVPSNIDESAFDDERLIPADYARRLALAKALDVAEKEPDNLVIGADTVVDCDGQIVGKPADAAQAGAIIRRLFSKPHKVITALAIVRLADNTKIVASDTTVVYPKKMNDRQIARHIASGRWRGKAGAYAIREHGDEFVEQIEGSLTNVMGLPMELLKRLMTSIP